LTYRRMVSIDSCLALSINPHVLITTMEESSFFDSWSASIPLPRSWVSRTSESTWFFEQPSVTMFTFVFLLPLAFTGKWIGDAKLRGLMGELLYLKINSRL